MKALVTGAAGFVGSHLVDRLLREGHEVIGIDNLCTGSPDNLASARTCERFRFIEADASEPLPRLPRLDRVFHLASPASPIDYHELALETLRVNTQGTDRCCALAVEHGARLLYASTSESYGDPLEHPQREAYFGNVNPIGPRSCYDEAKRCGEAIVAAYRRTASLDGRIVRIFNTYGPRMRRNDGRVVPAFITQALAGAPLTIFGEGTQTRSLCYVDDLVEGIVRYAELDAREPWLMNLGNDDEVTVTEIGALVAELCESTFAVEQQPFPENDPKRRRPDLSLARSAIGWAPTVPLRIGLARTIAWFSTSALTV